MSLKQILVHGLGTFGYSCENTIDHNLTTMLLLHDENLSALDALIKVKLYTLYRMS